jgi:hypothetical protein
MEDIPQPAAEPYTLGDRVRIHLRETDPSYLREVNYFGNNQL